MGFSHVQLWQEFLGTHEGSLLGGPLFSTPREKPSSFSVSEGTGLGRQECGGSNIGQYRETPASFVQSSKSHMTAASLLLFLFTLHPTGAWVPLENTRTIKTHP